MQVVDYTRGQDTELIFPVCYAMPSVSRRHTSYKLSLTPLCLAFDSVQAQLSNIQGYRTIEDERLQVIKE